VVLLTLLELVNPLHMEVEVTISPWVAAVLIALFPLSEIALAIFKRAKPESSRDEDRGSMRVLWIVITLAVCGAVACQRIQAAWLPRHPTVRLSLFLALLCGGLVLRWAAILYLGRFFTTNVAIHQGHTLVQSGLYRLVRHPSYTGMLVAFLGLAVFYWNWLSMVVLMVPITCAVINRIRKEERALAAAFGAEYESYCKRTKRLIPFVI
jgi:protein-S-isoprenylcysteine O-methyltransferase